MKTEGRRSVDCAFSERIVLRTSSCPFVRAAVWWTRAAFVFLSAMHDHRALHRGAIFKGGSSLRPSLWPFVRSAVTSTAVAFVVIQSAAMKAGRFSIRMIFKGGS